MELNLRNALVDKVYDELELFILGHIKDISSKDAISIIKSSFFDKEDLLVQKAVNCEDVMTLLDHIINVWIFNGLISLCEYKGVEMNIPLIHTPSNVLKEYQRVKDIVRYYWVASSDDGAFEDESKKSFVSIEECYNDMRDNALQKMKWNTEYAEDIKCMEDDEYIGYNVKFYTDRIVHTSYSGTYEYRIVVC